MPQGFEPVVGLEVHAQLLTETKLFCSCSARFGAPPNTLTCPVCAGHPGTLPVLNERALELAIAAGLAFGCRIARYTKFDRKNYFYPDLPKGYQITQYDLPLCSHGALEVETEDGRKRIGIRRIHLEEDSGKSIHDEATGRTAIDLNRCGTALIEIVSEPDIRSSAEAHAYLVMLRRTLRYLGISDCEMQEGSLRVDVNVSVRPKGSDEMYTPVEIKNLGSFRMVAAAIDYELERQSEAFLRGEKPHKQTMLWDDQAKATRPMRSKELAHEYRYFPEPDLPPLDVTEEMIERARASMCELPAERKERFVSRMGLTPYEAEVLTAEKELADYFERVAELCGNPSDAARWVSGEVLAAVKERGGLKAGFPVEAGRLAALVKMVRDGKVTLASARREVWPRLIESGEEPARIVERLGLSSIGEDELDRLMDEIIASLPRIAEDIRGGKKNAVNVLVGQLMKRTRGQADAKAARSAFLRKLGVEG